MGNEVQSTLAYGTPGSSTHPVMAPNFYGQTHFSIIYHINSPLMAHSDRAHLLSFQYLLSHTELVNHNAELHQPFSQDADHQAC